MSDDTQDAFGFLEPLPPLKLPESYIRARRHTRKQLAEWGVPWPPPKGWLRALVDGKPIPPS